MCKFWALIKTRKPSKPSVSRQFWTPSQPSQFPHPTCSWKMVGTKTPWEGQPWLWNPISRQKYVVTHLIGVWHTKIARINEAAFDIEATIPLFLSSPFRYKIILPFGILFPCISLVFLSQLPILQTHEISQYQLEKQVFVRCCCISINLLHVTNSIWAPFTGAPTTNPL